MVLTYLIARCHGNHALIGGSFDDKICAKLLVSFSSLLKEGNYFLADASRSLPFSTVDAIIGNQAFSHDRCNLCSGF